MGGGLNFISFCCCKKKISYSLLNGVACKIRLNIRTIFSMQNKRAIITLSFKTKGTCKLTHLVDIIYSHFLVFFNKKLMVLWCKFVTIISNA